MIRVVISGTGRMGSTVYNAITSTDDMEVVGVLDPIDINFNVPEEIAYNNDAEQLFELVKPDVVVDFTNTEAMPKLIEAVLNHNVRPVIGTSGITPKTLEYLQDGLSKKNLGGVVASNFAIGAVMLMHFSQLASKYFDSAVTLIPTRLRDSNPYYLPRIDLYEKNSTLVSRIKVFR